MPMGEHHIVVQKLIQRQIRRVIAIAMNNHVTRFRTKLHQLHQVRNLDAFPRIVEPRPSRHAMKVGDLARLWQCAKFLVRKSDRLLDQANDFEIPRLGIETRRGAVGQNWKFVGEDLSRRHPRGDIVRSERLWHMRDYYLTNRSDERVKSKRRALSTWPRTLTYRRRRPTRPSPR